jgi:hypothetical protein
VAYTSATGKNWQPFNVKTLTDILIFFTFWVNIFVTLVRNWWGNQLNQGTDITSWQ